MVRVRDVSRQKACIMRLDKKEIILRLCGHIDKLSQEWALSLKLTANSPLKIGKNTPRKGEFHRLSPWKLTSPKKGPSQNQKDISSSNHQFSREMLDFGGVEVFPSLKNPLVSRRFERLPVPLRLKKTEELEDLHRSEVFHLRSMVALSGRVTLPKLNSLPLKSCHLPNRKGSSYWPSIFRGVCC